MKDFYHKLPTYSKFLDVINWSLYKDIPPDWFVIITDIQGSTKAIEAGRYKAVNFVSAASITALLNLTKDIDIPFVFGGDGATILIPPELLQEATGILLELKTIAKEQFQFDLRVGIVPVKDIITQGKRIRVLRYMVSEHFIQSMFTGKGLTLAEQLIKQTESNYTLNTNIPRKGNMANFMGLECRWQDIHSKYGETISLLIMALAKDEKEEKKIYEYVFTQIETIYGDYGTRHPILNENLSLSLQPSVLRNEVSLKTNRSSRFARIREFVNVYVGNIFGMAAMQASLKTEDSDWSTYKDLVSSTTDHEKFDDTLRMVIAGTTGQRLELTEVLEKLYKEKKIVYGVHVSNRALMTCLVFKRNGKQVHFVDGADGGYAFAARELKYRLKKLLSS